MTSCSVLTWVRNTCIWFWKIITWWSISIILKQRKNHIYFQTLLRNIPLTSEREFWSCGSTLWWFVKCAVPGRWCVTVRKLINCYHASHDACKRMVRLLENSGLWSSYKNEMAPAPESSVFVIMAPTPAPELHFNDNMAPTPAPELYFNDNMAPVPAPLLLR